MLKFAKAKESKGKFVLQLVLFTSQKILEDDLDSSKIKWFLTKGCANFAVNFSTYGGFKLKQCHAHYHRLSENPVSSKVMQLNLKCLLSPASEYEATKCN